MDYRILIIKKYVVTAKGEGFTLIVKGYNFDRDLILSENDVLINIDGTIYANERRDGKDEFSPLRITEKFIDLNNLFFKPENL